MIYTTHQQLCRYKGISPQLDTALHWLHTHPLSQLVPGRNEIDGDAVFVNRFDYETVSPQQAVWEGHEQYADIHVLLSGCERIGVSDAADLTVTSRNPEEDFVGFEGPVTNWLSMQPGQVLIVFPEDVHMVKVQLDGECQVQKAVFKVRISSVL